MSIPWCHFLQTIFSQGTVEVFITFGVWITYITWISYSQLKKFNVCIWAAEDVCTKESSAANYLGVIRYLRHLAICLLTRKELVLLCIQEYSKPCLTLAYLETREICDLRHIQNLSISKGLMVFRSLSNML